MTFWILDHHNQWIDLDDPEREKGPPPPLVYPGCNRCGIGHQALFVSFGWVDGQYLCEFCREVTNERPHA